jgi:hypothetical protein
MDFFGKMVEKKGIHLLKHIECNNPNHLKHQPLSFQSCTFRHKWESSLCTVCLGFNHHSMQCSAADSERALISMEDQGKLLELGYLKQTYQTAG